jgi:hypothetical protein
MKRIDKVLWLLLLVGLVGAAVTCGVIVGDHTLQEPITAAVLDIRGASVELIPSQSDFRVEAHASAWLEQSFAMGQILSVTQTDGVLTVTQTPFPQRFLGMFPQPYALDIKLYLPQQVCDALEGELQ